MKEAFIIIILLIFGNAFSQDQKCLSFELYDSSHDVIGIQSSLNSDNGITNAELEPDSLQIIILPNSYAEFPKWTNYKRKGIDNGFKVLLINNTSKDFNLSNMDGSVIIRRQVYYKNEWVYIKSYDRTPRMICGNSYFHDKIIESGNTFTFIAPCLDGNFKAKFRFVAYGKVEKIAIYSNEFDGYFNKKLIE